MKENRVIILVTFLNFVVFITKLITGIFFSFSSLIADSIQSFVDFFTDIISIIANKIGKRRANKMYPFGYGQIYYLVNAFTGILLFIIGLFICYQVFFFSGSLKPNKYLFLILISVILIKLLVVSILHKYSKKYQSELMIESTKESIADLLSTFVVLIILIVSLFEKYIPGFINIDKIGSIGMAIYVFYTSFKMLISNIRGLLMNDEENNDLKNELLKDIETFDEFKVEDIKVIKMAAYYSVFLKIKPKENFKIKKYIRLEKKLKKYIKDKNKLVRFIDIEPV